MELVWIINENTYGYVVERHAFYSKVAFEVNGTMVEDMFDNDNLLDWKDFGIDYWSE